MYNKGNGAIANLQILIKIFWLNSGLKCILVFTIINKPSETQLQRLFNKHVD
jgi:hypothetical protein